jgi:LEA14-like dessication related protein
MKLPKLIGLASLGALGLFLLRQYSKAKEINFKLISVGVNRDKLTSLIAAILPLRIKAYIINPTDLEIELKGLKLDVYLNDEFIGNVFKTFAASTSIRAKDKSKLLLDADIDLRRIGKTIRFFMDYFQGLKTGKVYIKGYLITNFGSYQINENINL